MTEQTLTAAPVDGIVMPLDRGATYEYAKLLEDRAADIRERAKTFMDVDAARTKYGATLIRVNWQYADIAFNRPEMRHVCTWSNGDEGFVFEPVYEELREGLRRAHDYLDGHWDKAAEDVTSMPREDLVLEINGLL